MPKYDVYNKYGNKVGELRPKNTDNDILILIFLVLGAFLTPLWAAYKIGNGSWQYHGLLVRLISLFLLGLSVVAGGGSVVINIFNADYRATHDATSGILTGLGILSILYIMYLIGKSRAD